VEGKGPSEGEGNTTSPGVIRTCKERLGMSERGETRDKHGLPGGSILEGSPVFPWTGQMGTGIHEGEGQVGLEEGPLCGKKSERGPKGGK